MPEVWCGRVRVAIYDVHGNLPDLESINPDFVVVGGDVVAGPMPAEVLDRLAALGDHNGSDSQFERLRNLGLASAYRTARGLRVDQLLRTALHG